MKAGKLLLALAAALALGAFLGSGYGPAVGSWGRSEAPPAPPVTVERVALAGEEVRTIELFEAARDSVVAITTQARLRNPFTRRSYTQPHGAGSGFLWDDAGHVITNAHVIAGSTGAVVQLADGRSFDAILVGADTSHDLAVLRIEGRDLPPPLPVAPGGDLLVGQSVLAIGNPFGLDWTLTTGIVSALDREIPAADGRTIRELVQTDAAINPGNSGGPLLDSAGRLIGVNTAIFSPSGASAGIGFAVPVGAVNRVVPQLIARGQYSPPGLGILTDARINAAVNRQGLEGVMVLGVEPGTEAAAAGLEPARLSPDGRVLPGHVIVGIDGYAVRNHDDLLAVLDRRDVGDRVDLRVTRGGREEVVELGLIAGE